MSELREECYKCLNNQTCPSCADYGSIICMTKRKYEMPKNREDSVYATKFAVMQQQIKEKDKRIKELEEENSDLKIKNNFRIVGRYAEVKLEEILKKDYIPKQKVKDEIEALRKMLRATMEGKLQEYTPGEIIIKINTLEELLEDK